MAKSIADLVKEGEIVTITDPKIIAGFTRAFHKCSVQLRKQAVVRRADETTTLKKINTKFYRQPRYNPSRTSHVYSVNNPDDYSLLEPGISNILFL